MTREEKQSIIKGLNNAKQNSKLKGGICICVYGKTYDYVYKRLIEVYKKPRFKAFEEDIKKLYYWKHGTTLGRVRFINKLIKELESTIK